jgi:hypothetical protein
VDDMSLPRAARAADAMVVALLAAAVVVELTGGFSAHPWGLRISVTSGARILFWAALLLAIRHAFVRRPTLWGRWSARRFVDSGAPLVAMDRPESLASRLTMHAIVIVGFCTLTCAVMFEQVAQIRSVADLGDPLFSLWRLDWVAYQLRTDPLNLFNGNIFHPEPRTLAFSDAMLVPSLIAAPWLWAKADVVIVHNVLMLAASAFSGVTMFWLVRSLTRSTEAAVVSGAVFAYYPLRWAFQPHLELESTVWIPLALFWLHRMLESRRVRDGLATGLAVALQTLSSFYYGLFVSLYVTVVAAVVALSTRGRARPALRPAIAGIALAAVIIGPATLPYFKNRSTVGERSLGQAAQFSAHGRDYVAAPPRSRVYGDVLRGDGKLELFPGIMPIALTVAGLWLPLTPGTLAYAAGLGVALDSSLGVHGSTYPLLFKLIFPFRGLRAPDRFAVLVGFSLAVLAGFGVARILGNVQGRNRRLLLTAGLVAAVSVESSPKLNLTGVWKDTPPIYDSLPADPNTVLVDLPFPQRDGSTPGEYAFLYFATFHHKRIVNGGSGFYPTWYDPLADLMRHFPNDRAIAELKRHGAQYLVVHGTFYEPEAYAALTAALDARPDVKLVATNRWNGAPSRLYEILK